MPKRRQNPGDHACLQVKAAIAQVLRDEGYIADFAVARSAPGKALVVTLKYFEGQPVIDRIERVSRPGRRVFRGKDDLPKVMNGLGHRYRIDALRV
jgi:small subunit ribosomal protein S8